MGKNYSANECLLKILNKLSFKLISCSLLAHVECLYRPFFIRNASVENSFIFLTGMNLFHMFMFESVECLCKLFSRVKEVPSNLEETVQIDNCLPFPVSLLDLILDKM